MPPELTNVAGKSIAAGGYQTLETIFSPLLQYPVNVTNDLLLIYNSNCPDSYNVLAYYTNNRPTVAGANVLGVNCINGETFFTSDYTTDVEAVVTNWPNFAAEITNWLMNNPTKRPQYVVLFPGIPSRVSYDGADPWPLDGTPMTNDYPGASGCGQTPSVQYRLSTFCAGWQPFVTSLNMDGYGKANDCTNYINKLMSFAAPGQLFISASAHNYGNTNWYLQGGSGSNGVWSALPGANIITNFEITNNAVGNFTNLAGFCFLGVNGGGVGGGYATNGDIIFSGSNGWYIIETDESYNGERTAVGNDPPTFQGSFLKWFSSNGFGGTTFTSYQATPVGAVSTTDEPVSPCSSGSGAIPDIYFGLWAAGKPFATCAWGSGAANSSQIQVIGDPFVKR